MYMCKCFHLEYFVPKENKKKNKESWHSKEEENFVQQTSEYHENYFIIPLQHHGIY